MLSGETQVAVLFYRASEWSYLKRVNVYYPTQSGVIKNGKLGLSPSGYVTEFCLDIDMATWKQRRAFLVNRTFSLFSPLTIYKEKQLLENIFILATASLSLSVKSKLMKG
jgi:hypothetical protein